MRIASGRQARPLLRAVLLAASARACGAQNADEASASCERLVEIGACQHAGVPELCDTWVSSCCVAMSEQCARLAASRAG